MKKKVNIDLKIWVLDLPDHWIRISNCLVWASYAVKMETSNVPVTLGQVSLTYVVLNRNPLRCLCSSYFRSPRNMLTTPRVTTGTSSAPILRVFTVLSHYQTAYTTISLHIPCSCCDLRDMPLYPLSFSMNLISIHESPDPVAICSCHSGAISDLHL